MQSSDKAQSFREFLVACPDAPENTKIVVHSSLEYLIEVMDAQKALKVLVYADDLGNTSVRTEW